MNDPVRLTQLGAVAEITLDRPKVNAIDTATSRALAAAFISVRDDPSIRCAILTGAGRVFSAGWDLKAASAGEHEGLDQGPGGFAGLTELFDLYKPVVAAVNGPAIGGGFELALACDLIVAAEHATFALPEAGLGVMADAGGVQRLPRRLPHHLAMELLLTGRPLTAAEAHHHGLANRIAPGAEVLDVARELAAQIADGAPLTVQAVKQVVLGTEGMPLPQAFAAVRGGLFPLYPAMLRSEDHAEGPRAFAEGRKPIFRGR